MDIRKYLDTWVDAKTLEVTGEFAVILNEGEERESTFGTRVSKRPVFLVEHKKEQKLLGLTKTSMRELNKEYGYETSGWVGKVVLLVPTKVQIGNEIKNSIIVKPHKGPIPPMPKPITIEDLK